MAQFLKQSTAFTFRIGPFLDSTDAVTAETALTIAQADIQISKAGGAFAQTSASPTTTHDADGWYQCPLTSTDTGTVGTLTVQIVMAGALPVWKDFMVLPANVFDSLVGGTDALQVDTIQVGGTAQTARDIGASVLLSNGTGTGQVKLASGYVAMTWADIAAPTTTVNLSGTTISTSQAVASVSGAVGSVTGAVGSVTGNIGGSVASVTAVSSGAITEASFATTAGSFYPLGIIDQGTAQSATGTTLVLRSAAGFANDELLGSVILITGGSAGVGQTRVITDYVGSTDTATVDTWTTTPSGTITYKILASPDAPAANATTLADAILTRTMTEAYRADGAAPTLAQFACETLAHLGESSISGTTKTIKKFDGSTSAGTFTLDSATTPTSITRAT